MGDVVYRELTEADYETVAAVVSSGYPGMPGMSPDLIPYALDRADPRRPMLVRVAELNGQVIGSVFLRGWPGWPGLMLNVEVLPEHRRRGLGSELLGLALGVSGAGNFAIRSTLVEADPDALAFALHRGFRENDRMFESILDVMAFRLEAFAAARQAAIDSGLQFASLREVDAPGLRRRLHRLANALDADVPSTDQAEEVSYQEWVGRWIEAPYSRSDLLVMALAGQEPVAVSAISVSSDGVAHNLMTGVARSHRGRGLGLAIKVEALRRAKDAGLPSVRTENHWRNASMLAINERLGYRRLPGWIEVVRDAKLPGADAPGR